MLESIGPMRQILSKPTYSKEAAYIHKAIHMQSPLLSRTKLDSSEISERLRALSKSSLHPGETIANRRNDRLVTELSARLGNCFPQEEFRTIIAHCLLQDFDEALILGERLPRPLGLIASQRFAFIAKEIGDSWDAFSPKEKEDLWLSEVIFNPEIPESSMFSYSSDSKFSLGKLVRLLSYEQERIDRTRLVCAFKRDEIGFREFKQALFDIYGERLKKAVPTSTGVELIGEGGKIGIIGGSERALGAYEDNLQAHLESMAMRLSIGFNPLF